jgi:bifunctional DNA-binding transcriptional regulator/antitoxin component of YhaV-PrlF toxin-antitoxin module
MTVTVSDKEPLVVPLSVRRRPGFKGGQELEFNVSGGVVTIFPKLPGSAAARPGGAANPLGTPSGYAARGSGDESTPAQRRTIDAQLAGGLADVAAGRVRGPFSTHKEFIASLHKVAKNLRRKKTGRTAR